MFTSHKSVHPTRSFKSPAIRKIRKVRRVAVPSYPTPFITFTDNVGPVMTVYGVDSPKAWKPQIGGSSGNGYAITFWRGAVTREIPNPAFHLKVYDSNGSAQATYSGPSGADAVEQLVIFTNNETNCGCLKAVFHNESTMDRGELNYAASTEFTNGIG
tara:strand:- start:567 stop:1040 length:474 start_codon:yes stop_codon:yes gene_type:complete